MARMNGKTVPTYKHRLVHGPGDQNGFLGHSQTKLNLDHRGMMQVVIRLLRSPGAKCLQELLPQNRSFWQLKENGVEKVVFFVAIPPSNKGHKSPVANAKTKNGDAFGGAVHVEGSHSRSGGT